MVHRVCETREKRDYDATLERRSLSMSSNNAMDYCVPNLVLNLDLVDHSSACASDSSVAWAYQKKLCAYEEMKN